MRHMEVIAQQQAQCVFAWRKRQFGCCAGVAEMNMIRICWYRQPRIRHAGIDEQVVMA